MVFIMKNVIIIIFSAFITILNGICYASNQDPVKSFKRLVKQIDTFVSSSPISIHSEDAGNSSKSGTLYYLAKTTKLDISYDVKKTDSLLSPIIGYILLGVKVETNARYGDIKFSTFTSNLGYSYLDDALKNKRFAGCSHNLEESVEAWCIGNVRLNYAYQDGKWEFKDIDTEVPHKIESGIVRRHMIYSIYKNDNWKKALTPQ